MKKTLVILFLLFSCSVFATTYYVKNGGNDSNSGLSDALAWATINKANSALNSILNAGDRILFKRGDSWYGTLNLTSRSGLKGNPITIGAYGTGEDPIISGLTTIKGWKKYSTGIYHVSVSGQSTPNVVTINGINTPKGAYLNDGSYLTYESHGPGYIIDNQLSSSRSWTGAEVVIRRNDWVLDKNLITNHNNTTLFYSALCANLGDVAGNGNGYFLQNDLKCLDNIGDWCYRSGDLYMYFAEKDPDDYVVKISTLNRTLYIQSGVSYINIDHLSLEGGNGGDESSGNIEIVGASYITITNCNINYSGVNGISVHASANYVKIESSIINNSNAGCGLFLSDSHHTTVTNNNILNSGVLAGSLCTWGGRGIICSNDYTLIQYNRIIKCGNNGIQIGNSESGFYSVVNSNYIDIFCTLTNDGGGIYTQFPNGTATTYMTWSNNIILNGMGFIGSTTSTKDHVSGGIYLDAGTNYVKVLDNTVAYCANQGIKMSANGHVTVTGNNLFDNGEGLGYLDGGGEYQLLHNMDVQNNYIVVKAKDKYILGYGKGSGGTVSNMGTVNNNYYARPRTASKSTNCNLWIYPWNPYAWPETPVTFETWKKLSVHDQNSVLFTGTVTSDNNIHLIYNDTKEDKSYTLSAPMSDANNKSYSGTIVLLPFTSMMLIGAGTITEEGGE